MRTLLIIGSGAHGRVSLETAQLLGKHQILGFADDDAAKQGKTIGQFRVLGSWRDIPADDYFLAIGKNDQRARLFEELTGAGKSILTFVHPFSFVSPEAQIGPGSIVLAGAVIQSGARIGCNVIVNVGAVVDHDACIEDHAHIAPHGTVCSFGHVQRAELLPPGAIRLRPLR